MKKVFIHGALEPKGHYSPAVISGGIVYVSGQIAVDPFNGEEKTSSITEQTNRCLENILLILKEAGTSIDRIVKVTIFVSDQGMWHEVNEAYKAFMGDHKPARAIIPVNNFRGNFAVEIEAIAEV
ncbi:MAG: RidA family protein [Pyrinomonadaceae bacterium]